jgi:hypothetical protein
MTLFAKRRPVVDGPGFRRDDGAGVNALVTQIF